MKAPAWILFGLIAVLAPAIGHAQQNPGENYDNAQIEFRAGNFKEAWTDFSLYCSLEPRGEYTDYARLYIWLARVQLKQKSEADDELSSALEKNWNAGATDWVSKIAALFLDRIGEADFLAAADAPGTESVIEQHCEAWYYAGMKRLLAGDQATAIVYFRTCVATKVDYFTEYAFAQAELKDLGVK